MSKAKAAEAAKADAVKDEATADSAGVATVEQSAAQPAAEVPAAEPAAEAADLPASPAAKADKITKSGLPSEVAPQPDQQKGVKPRFIVTWNDITNEVVARDAIEAWALFCDANKVWPSPKAGKVVEKK